MGVEKKEEIKRFRITYNKTLFWIIIFLILVLIYIIYLIFTLPQNNELNIYACISDLDCVQASCCHSNSCVPKSLAPNCSGFACTMSCDPNTLDCGQGSCKCLNKKCEAIFN